MFKKNHQFDSEVTENIWLLPNRPPIPGNSMQQT